MEILTRRGEICELAKIFGVVRQTVARALRGESSSILADKIRAAAIERGGVVAQLHRPNKWTQTIK
jgi:transcriptional regulator with XRE-family HTH domain